jgi:hypothetical protein
MRPQLDDIAVIRGSILVPIGRLGHRSKAKKQSSKQTENSSDAFATARHKALSLSAEATALS